MKRILQLSVICLAVLLTACATSQINHSPTPYLSGPYSFAVLPFTNHTETPLAGERATAITASLMQAHGVNNIFIYQRPAYDKTLFPGITRPVSRAVLMSWARQRGAHYVMTGTVTEWSYKVGLDGEPVVGVTLDLVDVYTGRVVWTAVGSKSSGSRVALATVGQRLINSMLWSLFDQGSYHYER